MIFNWNNCYNFATYVNETHDADLADILYVLKTGNW